MGAITSVSTQRNNQEGKAERYRLREEKDIYTFTKFVLNGNKKENPIYATARGIIASKNDAKLVSKEMIVVQNLYKKTSGLRMRGEYVTIAKDELDENGNEEIKVIADKMATYFLGVGHQTAFGVYDLGEKYEIRFAINSVNYGDGSKYKRNSNDIQAREERCLATILSDVTGKNMGDEERFDQETLEYYV